MAVTRERFVVDDVVYTRRCVERRDYRGGRVVGVEHRRVALGSTDVECEPASRRVTSRARLVAVGRVEPPEAQHDTAPTRGREPLDVRLDDANGITERRVLDARRRGIEPGVAVLAVQERERFLHEDRRARRDRGVDEIARRLAPDALVLGPRRAARHLCRRRNLRREVHDCIVSGNRGSQRVGIEQVDLHTVRAERREQRLFLGAPGDAGHVVSRGDEPRHRSAPDDPGSSGHEHPHGVSLRLPPSASPNPDNIYPR